MRHTRMQAFYHDRGAAISATNRPLVRGDTDTPTRLGKREAAEQRLTVPTTRGLLAYVWR